MSQFRNLVFEGGGVKGIAYAGAVQMLEERDILLNIKRVAGTSAGAIAAALIALGANGNDLEDILGNTRFTKFMDDSFGVIRDIKRFLNDYGWFKGDAFSNWMQRQVSALSQNSDLTFSQLKTLASRENSRYRELYVVGTNLSNQLPEVYSAERTPDFPIWQAVRISMGIPLFFACVKSQQNNHVLVDGGVCWNYPIDLFDDTKYLFDPKAGEIPGYTRYDENHVYNKETLGFRVDTEDEIKAEKDLWRQPHMEIKDFFDFIKALVGFTLDMANKLHLHKNDWHRTVFIDAEGIRTTEFDLSQQKIDLLVANGMEGIQEYFNWFDNPNAKPRPLNRISIFPKLF